MSANAPCCDCADECTVDRTGFYTFTVAGVTGTDCSYANRGYCLAYDRCGCLGEVWADSGNGEPFQAVLYLVCHGGSQTAKLWIGRFPDEMPLAVYELAWASWTAAGPNVLTRTDANATCGDWPATITVSKSGSCTTEDCGCATATTKATAFEFEISGMAENGCFCSAFNRTWCISYSGFCLWAGSYEVLGCYPGDPLLPNYIFCTLSALCSDDQTCGADLYLGGTNSGFMLGFSSYHCDAFSCETGGVFTCDGSSLFCSATPTLGFPATITLTPSEICTPDPLPCQCTPKSTYSPRVELRGILDESCGDCSCATDLSLCFSAYGSDDEDCLWICEFTFPTGEPVACTSTATYAILNLFDGSVISLTFYNSSDAIVARYEASLYDFDCQASDYPLHRTFQDDTCTWPADATSLYMLGDECPTCSCDDGSWSVSIEYDGDDHAFCFAATDCVGVSDSSEIFGGGGDSLYVEVEFGTLPAQFARLRVYYLESGDPIGSGTLIGVYNFLADITSFDCAGSTNTLDLATGNAGQCGYLVDESGKTELLGAAAFLESATSCCTPGSETLTSSGSVVVPAGADEVVIEVWAAGGGGRGRGLISGGGGGGSGGGYSKTTLTGSVSGTYTCTIGAAGVGGATASNGTDASNSDVVYAASTVCKALGGLGATSGTGAASAGTGTAVGDVKYAGGAGGNFPGGGAGGGGGGGSAGTGSAGNAGSDGSGSDGGAGGTAVTGGGAGGNGGDNSDSPDAAASGDNPGGGGGGAGPLSSFDAGDGGTGKITITWTCP